VPLEVLFASGGDVAAQVLIAPGVRVSSRQRKETDSRIAHSNYSRGLFESRRTALLLECRVGFAAKIRESARISNAAHVALARHRRAGMEWVVGHATSGSIPKEVDGMKRDSVAGMRWLAAHHDPEAVESHGS